MVEYVGLLALFGVGVVIALALLGAAEFLGPRLSFAEKSDPFECGERQIDAPQNRFSIKFYMVALFFIIFDIEAVFLFPWAVIFEPLGILGFIEMMVFVGALAVGLVYVWRKGALEW